MYFCTSEPTTPTTSAGVDLTDCFQIFNNDNGATASTFQNQSINLTGTYLRPPNGTYTHGYAMMDNIFNLKASLEIDGSMDGQAGGSGVFCRTAEASGSYTKGSGAHTNDSICSDTEEAAGTYVETLTHFGTQSEAWQNTSIVNSINGTAASIKGIFVDENGHLAANEGEVDKFEGFTTFANPITINRNTIAITMSFGVGVATTLASAGDDKIYMGVGPFSAIFTAKQRARRRGGWR